MPDWNSALGPWILCGGVVAACAVSAQQLASPASVLVHLRVTDGAGLPVRDLAADELDVRIGGRARPARLVRPAAPADVLVLLDVSGSVGQEILDAYVAVVTALGSRIGARMPRVAAFDLRIEPVPDFGADRAAAVAFFNDIAKRRARPTALWDILVQATEEARDPPSRRAIVVVTDGHDAASRLRAPDVVTRAASRGIQIHAIQVRPTPRRLPVGTIRSDFPVAMSSSRAVEPIVTATGGSFVELKANAGVVEAVTVALEDIANQIELEIDVTGVRSGRHDVRVRVARPHLTVRAPRTVVLTADARR
jgi:hypothetical protein